MTTRKIARTLSTQHPDNANIPFFSNYSVLQGDDEIKETYYLCLFPHGGS